MRRVRGHLRLPDADRGARVPRGGRGARPPHRVPLRYEELSARERRAIGERSRFVDATQAAQDFFAKTLYTDAGKVARDYLKARGFGVEDAKRFELGFAPNEWESMSRALTADGVKAEDLIAVGVTVRNDRGGLRDRFRGRLMFPVHDPGGDVIGFGGRILDALDYGDFDPPKYLNSPETPLYKKTRVLYGVPQARADIVRAEQVLVCEGYTDVMALHQAGFANAVATCGTAVGVEHLRMVSRYASRVVLAFDGDEAGVKAAERAWEGRASCPRPVAAASICGCWCSRTRPIPRTWCARWVPRACGTRSITRPRSCRSSSATGWPMRT
jgi:DNA primase